MDDWGGPGQDSALRLICASEPTATPLVGDGLSDQDHVARQGSFQMGSAGPDEAWITAGEALPADGWRGDTSMARVRWA